MNETKHKNNAHGGPNDGGVHPAHGPYWKRAHHDWRFWVAVAFIFSAMIIYVMSVEFVLQPRRLAPAPADAGVK
jgi:hypothetical protein